MDATTRALNSITRKEGEFTLLLDEQFDILWASESVTPMLGWSDVVGRNGTEFVHPDDLELVLETMMQVIRGEAHQGLDAAFAPESADIRVADVNGDWHDFETTTWNHLEDERVRGVLCTCRRVHDRSDLPRAIEMLGSGADVDVVLPVIARLAEHSMGGAEVRVAIAWKSGERTSVVNAVDRVALDPRLCDVARGVWSHGLTTSVVVTDLDDSMLDGAGSAARDSGFKGAFIVPIESPGSDEVIGAMVAWSASTIDFQAPEQSPLHVALRLAALAIADHRTKRKLRWAAAHDPLTGLVNRAEFERSLDEMSSDDLVLLYIDLDDFKPINDVHGHPVGDLVLKEVARRIAAVIRPGDVVGRLGGDEFAVVCPGLSDPVLGRLIGDRIVKAIRVPLIADGLRLSVGASVGVAIGAQPLIPAILVRRADEALYTAKHSGKNTVCLAS